MKFLFFALLLTSSAFAADFPALYNSEPGNPSPMPPQEALKALKLPKGFKATLFAAEPEVQNPIGLAWDARGRMWVAENYTYAERAKRFDLGLKDRVIILEDKDWDGVAETRKVFTEEVQMLTSVEVGRGGGWLMCPPQVLFIPDRNNDDIPDGEPEVVIDGFPDDQRIPMKGGIWRYHPEKKIVEVLTHGTTNPWGHDWDANGEMFFINTVTGHLWHLMHGAHLTDGGTSNPFVYEKLDTIADHYHYDRSGSWTASRDGKANSLGGGHAHIGMMIYQAEQWPEEYRNKLFTLNMHGRRANVERLERNGSGYVGKHEPDVFLSDDPWFRGIEISTGPDGSGFILDWSDTGECHDSTGVHRTSGRIFRISCGDVKKPETPFAWRKPWPKADLNSADEHGRALAIRELTQFSPLDAISGPMAHAVYSELGFDAVKLAREDKSSFVRLTLASTLQRLPVAKRAELGAALLGHAEDANDPFLPYLVWYGISPLAKQDPQALVALAKDCMWPKTLRWIARSLATQPDALNALLAQAKAGQVDDILGGMADAFKGIRKVAKPEAWEGFVTLASARVEADPERAKARTTNSEPAKAGTTKQVTAEATKQMVQELSILFGDGRALDDVKKLALDEKADLSARESALKTLIENRPVDLRAICTQLLEVRGLNVIAVRGLALFNAPEIGQKLAASYRKFAPLERPTVIDTLVSRPSFAQALLKDMAAGKIPRADLSAFHARQINAFKDAALTKQLVEVWGELRESAADKKELIEKVKKQLSPASLAKANLSQGRVLFTAVCGSCHTMYGQGGKIGPDLTGSGRANLDYLLENIADPSGVVSADFRMSLLTHKDGRVLSGVVAESNSRTLTLRTITETLTLERADIVKQETSPLSMMPEGLLLAFQPEQVRDLIAYLMHPVQVPLPKAAP